MTTKTEMNTTTSPHWAAERGRAVAAQRAARLAEAEAEAAATGQRAALPAAELARRFGKIAVRVVEAVDVFGRAAAIDITGEPTGAGLVVLHAGVDRLELRRQDEQVTVRLRALSRGDEFSIDLDVDAFDPEPPACRIAGEFIAMLALSHGGSHV